MLDFPFHTTQLTALPSGGLWWAEQRLLCVSDLHLAKSERFARSGNGLLPPYETAETLSRLASDIASLQPAEVICLGDSFDDDAGQFGISTTDRDTLLRLMAGRSWTWIEGNHDPGPLVLPGGHRAEVRVGGLTFRHIARADAPDGEVSGHFHPKKHINVRGRTITRKCFLTDGRRLILPAYGTYTGGLRCDDPVLAGLFDGATAILTGNPPVAVPM